MRAIATNFMARAIRPALAVALCLCVSVTADAGNGFIVVDLDGNSQDGSVALSRADDGTLLVLANSASDPSSLVAHGILAFDPAGLAVSSFGSSGYASLEQPSPVALANRPDGVLVTTGGSSASLVSSTGQIQKLVALPSDSPGSGAMFGQAVAALDDNRVIVGGGYGQGGQSDTWALARFNTDGSLDTTFDGSGWRRKDASPSVRIDSVHALPDGSSLAAGAGTNAAVIGRFNADGTTDFTFGTNGLVTLPNCVPICQRALLAVDASGRIYTEGGANALIRLNPDGSIDGSYASVPIAPDLVVVGIAIDSAGRVVLFGTLLANTSGYIARFLPSGARDASFGVDGEAIVRPGSEGSYSVLTAGLIQPDDKPVALMTIEGERDGKPRYGTFDIGLFRFTAGGVLDTSLARAMSIPTFIRTRLLSRAIRLHSARYQSCRTS